MAVITPGLISNLLTVFKKDFQLVFDAGKEKDLAALFLSEIPSGSDSSTYNWMGLWPSFQEWVKGQSRTARDIKTYAYQVKNLKYESTVEIPSEDIEDDNLGYLRHQPQAQADAFYLWKMEQVTELLKNGASKICYDGQNYFDAEHPFFANVDGTGTESKQSNIIGDPLASGDAWFLLDLSKPLKPLLLQTRRALRVINKNSAQNSDVVFDRDIYQFGLDFRGAASYTLYQLAQMSKETLNKANFDLGMQQMLEMKRDGNKAMNISPTHLIVPPSLRATAKELIEIDRVDNGKGNANYKAVELVLLPGLA